jgi:serine/threonine-protein kinase
MTTRPDPRVATTLGPYRIEAVLGRGGMGVVYLATHTGLDRRVALKLLTPDYADDEAFRARFLRESKLAASIDHPNIIPIYDAGEIAGTYYLAMRYVEGTDLETRFRAGPLAPRETVHLVAQVASALDAAADAGLVHRDVKPANILIASGKSVDRADHAYLTDFGLTKHRGSQTGLTRAGAFMGTLEYIAPEQIEGKAVDGRADQYALAAIAVACLTGEPPFPRDSDVAIINAHLRAAPPSMHDRRPDLPPAADAIIARGLAKRPDDRYPDCKAFVDDLRSALGVTATQPRPRPVAAGRRRTTLIVAGAAVLVVALAAGAIGLSSNGPSGPTSSLGDLAGTSPSVSDAPSQTADVYPNAAEKALLGVLPADLRATCDRGSYEGVRWDVFAEILRDTRPEASVTCSPPGSGGADEVRVRQFRATGLAAGNAGFTVDSAVSAIAARGGIPGGDCSAERRVSGRWELGGQDMGALLCSSGAGRPTALLYWTYKDAAILVLAINESGDGAALYDYFLDTARFISP